MTELRSKAAYAVELLKEGRELLLIHRSKIIGKIVPTKQGEEVKLTDLKAFIKTLEGIKPKKTIPRSKRKREMLSYLKKRYG